MNEQQFEQAAEQILRDLQTQADYWFDELDVELEVFKNGNVLTIIFENGSQVIVNSQAPMREMWLAARSGGYHYRRDQSGVWRDTKTQRSLHEDLSRVCSEQSGHVLEVSL